MPIFEFDVVKPGEGERHLAVEAPDMAAAQAKAMAMGYGLLNLTGVRDEPGAVVKPKPPPDLAPAPRSVPLVVCLANLLGGFPNQFGWIWLGLSLFFLWFFGLPALLVSQIEYSGTLQQSSGVVKSAEATNFSVNRSSVYVTHFVFNGPDGLLLEGCSYGFSRPADGTRVTVEWPAGNPAKARIQGLNSSKLGAVGAQSWFWSLFPLIFVGIGISFLFFGLRAGVQANRLLARGKPAYGRLKSREMLALTYNRKHVWKLTFGFTTEDGIPAEAVVKTPQPELVTDEADEKLLYDPQKPASAVLLNILPSGAAIDYHGQIVATHPLWAARTVVVPFLVLTVHGVVGYFLLWL